MELEPERTDVTAEIAKQVAQLPEEKREQVLQYARALTRSVGKPSASREAMGIDSEADIEVNKEGCGEIDPNGW